MPDLDATLMKLTMSLARVARAYTAAADKVAGEFGLSQATAWPLLMTGRLGDGARPGAVAEALGLDPSSLVRVIDQLIQAGLLERREDASDRRAKTLHLTARGRKCAAKLEEALVPFRRQLFAGADKADLQACMRVLDALNAATARI
jgi:MarR family transcriptional regulator for hemolysin